jgi:hypothetical protein
MAVSGKTAAPWEIPYFLGADKPPDMAAVTKAIADRTHAVMPSGTLTDGKLVIVNTGAQAFKAMSGDATIDKEGALTIGGGKVTRAKIAGATLQTQRVSTGSLANGVAEIVTLTWPSAFADTSYTIGLSLARAGGAAAAASAYITSKSAAAITVQVVNNSGGANSAFTVEAIAIHD